MVAVGVNRRVGIRMGFALGWGIFAVAANRRVLIGMGCDPIPCYQSINVIVLGRASL